MEIDKKDLDASVEVIDGSFIIFKSNPSVKVDVKKEKRRIWKNILLISLAFFLNFNAFQSLSRLQSSLNIDDGLGVAGLSVLYAALVVSCMFLPQPMISLIGHKWTIAVSFIGYILWDAANGHPSWGTLIPASIIVGACAAPLWTAQCAYFTKMGALYAKITGEKETTVVSRFFGVFFLFFQFSSISGSIISSTILRPETENGTETKPEKWELEYCGAKDCPDKNTSNPNYIRPDNATIWTMLGVYIAVAVVAVIIVALFVDQLRPELQEKKEFAQIKSEIKQLLIATFKHTFTNRAQVLLIVMTMYSGFEQAAYNAEWTSSFITCSIGVWKVGLVTLPFGVMNCIVSFSSGMIVKYTGRLLIFCFGMGVDLCIQITLMLWMPDPDKEFLLYIISGLWGITDGIWQTQINSLYGCTFANNSEAAFSNYRLWESIGFIIPFAYSSFLCTSVKLYILTSVLVVGMAGYGVVEYQARRKIRKEAGKPVAPPVEDEKGMDNPAFSYQSNGTSLSPRVSICNDDTKF